jgi:hypothetical protein
VLNTHFNNISVLLVEEDPETTTDLSQVGRHGLDRMVVEFTTTYVISAYHH